MESMMPNGPVTLTRQQFKKRKPNGDYSKYLSYIGANRPGRMAARQDPLRPRTNAEIQSRVRSDANAAISPLIAQLTKSIEDRAKSGMGAIQGYHGQLAQNLGGEQARTAGIWGSAQEKQAAADAALSGTLSGTGSQLQEGLAAKLAQINAPGAVTEEIAGGAGQVGAGSAGALAGRGNAVLSALISRGAAAEDFAGKLPGWARAGGVQASNMLQRQSQRDIAEGTGEIRAQIPGLVSELSRSERGLEFDKNLARMANEREVTQAQAAGQVAQVEAQSAARAATLEYQRDIAKLEREHAQAMEKAEAEWRRSAQDKAAERRYDARQKALQRKFEAAQKALDRKAKAKVDKATRGKGPDPSTGSRSTGASGLG